ncbi:MULTISPECIES: hypothetical protein [Pseudomonas]|uniref:hypothetical protein n=1 Tax=Pseudomonas TaxID=286 RepID=UPI0016035F53|nr:MULTISPECIES: hypothetical protein [Pseudomonas]MDS9876020.1 hypothetical protein [Pseudomonas protegens]URN88752.1 MAG: hypothetical protein NAG77_28745 [Pseudomonas protegens]WEK26843.1 MAG: hypothetical protein P0Y61_10970 [Pseudomonas protegens]
MKEVSPLICTSCEEQLDVFNEGSTQGLRCSGCGWSLVTTHISDIKIDEREYKIFCSGNYKSEAHVRVVSEVAGYNFLMSRKALQKGQFLLFSGQAVEVSRVRKMLGHAGVLCTITPDFKWG